MLNWYLGFGAIGLWLVATLIYLKRPIANWITGKLEARRVARRAIKPGDGPPRRP